MITVVHNIVPGRPARLADALAGTEGIKGKDGLACVALLLPLGLVGIDLL